MTAPYVARMRQELSQLDERRRALKYFLKGPTSSQLPEDKRKLMTRQVEVMEEYKEIMIKRLELEK